MDSDEESPSYFQSTLLSTLHSQIIRKRLRKAGGTFSDSDLVNFTSYPDLEDYDEKNSDDEPTPASRDSEKLAGRQSHHDALKLVSGGEEINSNRTEKELSDEEKNEKADGSWGTKAKKFRKVNLVTFESGSSKLSSDPVLDVGENETFDNENSIMQFDSEHSNLKGCDYECLKEAPDDKNDHHTETVEESREHKDAETPKREENEKKKAKKRRERDQISTKLSKQEKRKHFSEFRAESQWLLRERGNVSFKPARMVQKSVSSVLDKIRKRKEDTLKAFEDTQINQAEEKDIQIEIDTGCNNPPIDEATESSIDNDDKNIDNEQKEDPESPKNITNHSTEDDSPDLTEEGIMGPSILVKNLKNNSSDDEQSDVIEEKLENFGVPVQSSPIGQCFAKAFLDEEAEEEPDSNNEIPSDDEEEDESNEGNDLIATNFEEDPTDKQNLDELHQEWLEQQDAAGTEKLLYKFGHRNVKENLSPSKEDDSESDDSDPIPPSNARLNLKKAKEMFHLLYTDTNDVYVSSDEDVEATLEMEVFRERGTLETPKMEVFRERGTLETPKMEGENLRIKITNVVEKKKPENNLSNTSINLNQPKTSFFGREVKGMSSLQRSGSSKARSFIFERSESNDGSATMGRTQKVSLMRAPERNQRTESSTKLERSLHEILKCSVSKVSAAGSECSEEIKALYASLAVSSYARKPSTTLP